MAKLPAKPSRSQPARSLSQTLADLLGRALGSTADETGRALGSLTKTYFEDLEKQRVENLAQHKLQVEERLDNPIEDASPKDVKRLLDWVEGAQDIDNGDPELAAIWRLTLEAIYRKDYDIDHILDKVRQLRAPEAKALLSMKKRWDRYPLDDYVMSVLLSHGLIEAYRPLALDVGRRRYLNALFRLSLVFATTSVILYFSSPLLNEIFLITTRSKIPLSQFVEPFFQMLPVLLALGGLLGVSYAWREFVMKRGEFRPTSIGRRIIELSRKYRPQPETLQKE